MNDSTYRIMGIDPGTSNLGIAMLDYDNVKDTLKVVTAYTISTDTLLRKHEQLADILTTRGARLYILEEGLRAAMSEYQPHVVASEAPFLGRFPQAFMALVECLASIRRVAYEYRPWISLTSIDPPTIKMAVDVYARSNVKDEMTEGVRNYPGLDLSGIDIDVLDEHSIDAIAVAICKHRMNIGTAKVYVKKKKKRKHRKSKK